MKIKNVVVILFLFTILNAFTQSKDSKLDTYLRNFEKGNTDVKLELIDEAAGLDSAELAPLFHRAIEYAISNSSSLSKDSDLKELTVTSIREVSELKFKASNRSLLRLFEIYDDPPMREIILNVLAGLGKGDGAVVAAFNKYLETQNNMYKTNKKPDKKLVTVCIQTLAALDDASSFTPIFNTMVLGYSDSITSLAYQTLLNLSGDFRTAIFNIIKHGMTFEKKRALEVALENKKMEESKKAEIAEYALDIGLTYATLDVQDQKMIREIKDMAVEALGGFRWSKATGLIISHFEITLVEYERRTASKSSLLIAIAALGNMGTHEAAERLTLYLKLLNTFTENKKPYDTQIVLVVINNLGKLKDKIAFDDLSYTKYLNYTDEIKTAAQASIKNLQW